MWRTSKMAVGVSIIAQMSMLSGAPAAWRMEDTSSMPATEATLGMTTAAAPDVAAAARSSAPHGVSSPLQRMVSSRWPYSPEATAAHALARADSFASGATASSRSKMIESAGMVLAFSSARSLAAGMYSTERRGRSAVWGAVWWLMASCQSSGRVRIRSWRQVRDRARRVGGRVRQPPCTVSPRRRLPSCRRA